MFRNISRSRSDNNTCRHGNTSVPTLHVNEAPHTPTAPPAEPETQLSAPSGPSLAPFASSWKSDYDIYTLFVFRRYTFFGAA